MRLKQLVLVVLALMLMVSAASAEDRKVWATEGAFVTSTLEEAKKLYQFIKQSDKRAFATYGDYLSRIGHVEDCYAGQEFFLVKRIDGSILEIRPVGSPDNYFGFSVYFDYKKEQK